MSINIQHRIKSPISRDTWLDLDDRLRAEALKAFEMVREHSGLTGKSARALEGQARFRMMEKGFQEVCERHGGFLLDGGVIPNTDLKVFQPFMRFEKAGTGIILGMAAMPEPATIPTKNKSRLAGVSLNYDLVPRLDLDGKGPKVGDIFVLFLIARDREKGGKIEEVAIGVIDSKYEAFVYYKPLNQFLSAYAEESAEVVELPVAQKDKKSSGVSLKAEIKPFIPPEVPDEKEDEANAESDGPA